MLSDTGANVRVVRPNASAIADALCLIVICFLGFETVCKGLVTLEVFCFPVTRFTGLTWRRCMAAGTASSAVGLGRCKPQCSAGVPVQAACCD